MKKVLQLSMLFFTAVCFGQTPLQTFNFENNLTNAAGDITLSGIREFHEPSIPDQGQALQFNQSANGSLVARVNGSIPNIPVGNSARTFSFWLKVAAPANNTDVNSTIFQTGSTIGSVSPFQGFGFYRVPFDGTPAQIATNTRFEIKQGTHVFASISGGNAEFDNKWRFYTITFTEGTFNGTPTGGMFRIYIDGALVSSNTVPGEIATSGNGIQFGGNTSPSNTFSIDKFNIYGSTLFPAQITTIYREEIKPVVPSPQALCSGRSLASVDVQEIPNVGATLRFFRGGNLTPISNTLIAGDYQVSQVIGTTESNRAAFTVTLSTAAAPSISSTLQVCIPNGVYDVQDLPTSPGTNIKWYSAATGGSPLTNVTPITSGTTYYASQTVGICESSRTAVLVTTGLPNTPVVSQGSVSLPAGSTVADLVATPTGFVVWYASEANASSGTNPLTTTTPLQNNTTHYGKTEISGCRSTGRVLVTITLTGLSVSDFNTNLKIKMYPNPANSILNIDLATDLKSVEIYSLQGQKVLSATEKQINISGLATGIYMVKVADGNGAIATQKLVKN